MNETLRKKRSFQAIKWVVVGFVLCILTIVIIAYGLNWYYENKLLPSDIDSGVDITTSKSYQEYREQIVRKAESEVSAAKDEYNRWLELGNLSVYLIDEGKIDMAEAYAKEILDLAPKYKDSWNYGNAIHKGHIALGRIALRRNNIKEG